MPSKEWLKVEETARQWKEGKKAFKKDCLSFYEKWTVPFPWKDALVEWTKEVIDEMDWEEIQPNATEKKTITIEV